MTILSVLVILGVIFLLSFLTESLVEYLFSPLFEKIPFLTPHKWMLMYVAGVVGIVGAFLYGFDLLYLLGNYLAAEFNIEKIPPAFMAATWYGKAMTGIAISRGSNFLHDLVSKFFTKPKSPGAQG